MLIKLDLPTPIGPINKNLFILRSVPDGVTQGFDGE
jgi:hypothetical protein